MATLTAIFTAQDKLSKTLANAGNQGSKLQGIMGKIGSIGSAAMKGIITAVTAAGTALLAFGKNAISVGMNFETSMSQVMATMGKTTATAEGQAAYEALSAAAEKMGAETAFTASQAADALNYLALAGYDVDQSVAALPTVLHLAGAGGMELSRASDMITDSMAALQMEVNQTNLDMFADQMAKTASTTNTSVSQLGEAILTVGATAANLRNGTTELNTQLGILANVGIKGAEGGTHLRNILMRLQSPTDKAAAQLKSLGVSVYDIDGKMRDTGAIFEDLKNSMVGMEQSQIDQIMSTLFNKTDIAAANALLAASGDEYNRIFDIIKNSSGAAQEMYETMLDNLKGDVDIFNSATEALYLAMYKNVNGVLRDLVQTGTSYMGRLLEAFNAGGFSGLAGELGNVLGDAVTKLVGYVPNVVSLGSEIITNLVDGIGRNAPQLASAAVDIGVALLKGVTSVIPALARAVGNLFKGAISGIVKGFPKMLSGIRDSIYNLFNAKKLLRRTGFAGIIEAVGTVFNIDTSKINKAQQAFARVSDTVKSVFGWLKQTSSIVAAAFTFGNRQGGFFKGIQTAFGALTTRLKGVNWSEIGSTIWTTIKTGFTDTGDWIKQTVLGESYTPDSTWGDVGSSIWETIKGGFTDTGDWIKQKVLGETYTPDSTWGDVGSQIWETVKGGITATGDWLKEKVLGETYTPDSTWGDVGSKIWETVKGGISATGDWLKEKVLGETYTPDSTWGDVGSKIWETIKGGISDTGDWLKDKLGYTPDTSWSTIGGDIWTKIKSGISDAGDWLKTKLGYSPSASWIFIGNELWTKIKSGISETGDWLKTKLGYTPDASWSEIGKQIWETIKSGIGDTGDWIKTKLDELSGEGGVIGTLSSGLSTAMDTAESIAGYVGDAVTKLSENGTVGEIWNSVLSICENIKGIVGEVLQAFTGVVGDAGEAVSEAPNAIVTAVEAISTAVSGMAGGLGIVNDILSKANEIGLLGPALEGVGAAIATYFIADKMVSATQAVISFFKALAAGNLIAGSLAPQIALIAAAVGGLVALASWARNQVKLEDNTVGDYLYNDFTQIGVIAESAGSSVDAVTKSIHDQITSLVQDFGQLSESEGSALESYMLGFMTPEGMNWEAWYSYGVAGAVELINGMRDGMAGAGDVTTAAGDIASQVTTQLDQAMQNTTIDTTGMFDDVGADAQTASAEAVAVLNAISTQLDATSISTAGQTVSESLGQGLASGQPTVDSACDQIASSVKSAFSGIRLNSVGANIVQGLRNGMQSMFGSLLATARQMASQLKSTIQAGMQVSSPSRFTMWVGEMVGQGLANGLEASASAAMAAAGSMADGVTRALTPVSPTAPTLNGSGYTPPTGGEGGGISTERRIVIDLVGGGRLEVSGMSRESAMDMISDRIMPMLKQALADEIYEGGNDVYEF